MEATTPSRLRKRPGEAEKSRMAGCDITSVRICASGELGRAFRNSVATLMTTPCVRGLIWKPCTTPAGTVMTTGPRTRLTSSSRLTPTAPEPTTSTWNSAAWAWGLISQSYRRLRLAISSIWTNSVSSTAFSSP